MNGAVVINEAMRSTPPLAVLGAWIVGLDLQDWVFVLTLFYLFLQIVLVTLKILKKR